MSSAGHVMDMIKRMAFNRSQQIKNKHRLDDTFPSSSSGHMLHGKFNEDKFKPQPESSILENRQKIQKQVLNEQIVPYLKSLVVLVMAALLLYYLVV